MIQGTTKAVSVKASKIGNNGAINNSVDNYINSLTKNYSPKYLAGLRAERFAVEAAKDHFAKNGYRLLYDAKNGINGPDLIFKKGDEILIVETKGAMASTTSPVLSKSSLYTSKSKQAQLSHNWLSTNYNRYLNEIRQQNQEAYDDVFNIINRQKNYKSAVVYAADNPAIEFGKGIDDYMTDIVADPMIDAFELLKFN